MLWGLETIPGPDAKVRGALTWPSLAAAVSRGMALILPAPSITSWVIQNLARVDLGLQGWGVQWARWSLGLNGGSEWSGAVWLPHL